MAWKSTAKEAPLNNLGWATTHACKCSPRKVKAKPDLTCEPVLFTELKLPSGLQDNPQQQSWPSAIQTDASVHQSHSVAGGWLSLTPCY